MPVTFQGIRIGQKYSRPQLADLWGYRGYQALARGVVTPRDSNFIILFVTEYQQTFQEQYDDRLTGKILQWEGPRDHFAEDRMENSHDNGDEIHVFHRERHHSDFTYIGRVVVLKIERRIERPSTFQFRVE
ncbi:hypothetical protein Pcar_3181 [Syntrophotalea carbinolica DSM 2380]|uniref:Uncharacterized protein n=1 Tax=Syntrophotalea carbinolica (strain DSM 2380 / NBRC 103641 / GraBd1) TaxID=338963 RepID=Q0C6Y6_SYNC1|nr:hypothetical protein [Syntrophotalea carbinolica]ABI81801.1 hypothetical protein Pcar_3181 [Syntrophotalea carbinolica DSM 2380]